MTTVAHLSSISIVGAAAVFALAACPVHGVAGTGGSGGEAGSAATSSSDGGSGGNAGSGTSGGGNSGGGGAETGGGGAGCNDALPAEADGLGLYDPQEKHFYLLRAGGAGEIDFNVVEDGTSENTWPIAGNWSGQAGDYVGTFDVETAFFRLRASHTAADPVVPIQLGAGDPSGRNFPVAGDWGSGTALNPMPLSGHSAIGIYTQLNGYFNLDIDNSGGAAEFSFSLGASPNDFLPIAGDWDGIDVVNTGIFNPASQQFFLIDSHENGATAVTFKFARAKSTWLPLAGDWDGDAKDDVGLYDQKESQFHLRVGSGDYRCIQFGSRDKTRRPLAGKWGP